MSETAKRRTNNWQKATALVPLALLSGAWTATLASSADAATAEGGRLPDGTTVPTEAIEAPASVSNPGEIAPGIPAGSADDIISSASTNGIPGAALAAYQRAELVINSADPSCNIDWPLIGAIGRVESDHGRYGGNVLSAEGVSTPGIYGIPLDGTNGTQKISDTDAGQYDDDQIYDRAVGPMQFIPSTWQVVGVDGDGDGVRNPQDIDDASLATAVYLCSGKENLATRDGQETSVYRYNHSQEYVDLVLAIADAYRAGDYTSVPTAAYSPVTFSSSYDDSVFDFGTRGYFPAPQQSGSKQSGGSGGSTTPPPTTATPAPAGGDTGSPLPSSPGDGLVTQAPDKIKSALTPLQVATQYCQDNLTAAELDTIGGLSACTDAYLAGGATAVQDLLASLLGGLVGGGSLLP